MSATRRVDTLMLFLSDLETDFAGVESQEWNMILVLLERERPSSNIASDTSVSTWFLDTFKSDLRGPPAKKIFWLLTFALEVRELTEHVLGLSNNMVGTTFGEGGFTAVHDKIAEGFLSSVVPSIKLLAERRANLHLVGCTTIYGAAGMPQQDAPTSLSMRRSEFFFEWRRIIEDLGLDLVEFVKEEMKQYPLLNRGWDETSLLALFRLEYETVEMYRFYCRECNREAYRLYEIKEEW